MKASETALKDLLDSTKQYIVPLYQRPYSWNRQDWSTLWDDLVYLFENPEPPTHFMGSIVTAPAERNPAGVTKYLLIDGQQRMTTLSILLCALRDAARESGEEKLAEQLQETYIVNKFHEGSDRFKLIPTQSDREVFFTVAEDGTQIGRVPDTEIDDCYAYFRRMLRTALPEGAELRRLMDVIVGRLSLVSIALGDDDNPHLVFESLNGKGRPLTQGDLIRNYFFMRIPSEEQDTAYTRYWLPMQEALQDSLTEFVRHYLISQSGSWIKISDVYYVLKHRVDAGLKSALEALKGLAAAADIYTHFLDPARESDPELSEAYEWLLRAKVTTIYPLLLGIIADLKEERLQREECLEVLKLTRNYILRRAVCAYPTNQLNKVFSTLYRQVVDEPGLPFPERIRRVLQSRGYPSDSQFRKHLIEGKLYGRSSRELMVRLLLETLEKSYEHKERANLSNLSIEHVMPQTLSDAWIEMLGDEAQIVHELYLHTLGNLTLTGYNAELSNTPFSRKKELLERSHLELNQYFSTIEEWNREAIVARANHLSDRALKVWPYFGDESEIRTVDVDMVTGSAPTEMKLGEREIPVRYWREVLTNTIEWLADYDYQATQSLISEYPRILNFDASELRKPFELANGWFCETNLSAKAIYTFCRQATELVGLQDKEWSVRVLEGAEG